MRMQRSNDGQIDDRIALLRRVLPLAGRFVRRGVPYPALIHNQILSVHSNLSLSHGSVSAESLRRTNTKKFHMNTIIEYILYTFGILLLIAAPLALIAGGLASRSVVVAPNTGDDCTVADVANQRPNVVPANQTDERELTVTS